jgi:hypothetical protein
MLGMLHPTGIIQVRLFKETEHEQEQASFWDLLKNLFVSVAAI